MIGRLRALLGQPLDPVIIGGLVVLGGTVCVGFATLVTVGLLGPLPSDSARPAPAAPRVGGRPIVNRPTPTSEGMRRGHRPSPGQSTPSYPARSRQLRPPLAAPPYRASSTGGRVPR
jgi:hypothetical protein